VSNDLTSVAVIVVGFNSADVLGPCLGSLPAGCRGYRLTDVLVVDNASADDTEQVAKAAMAEHALPLTFHQLGRNAGYAAAINAGTALLAARPAADRPDAVLVLNPDARMSPGSLGPLAAALAVPGRGIAVPMLRDATGGLELSLRREPSLRHSLLEATLGRGLAARTGRFCETITDAESYARPGPAAWATGAAMLISWAAVAAVGPWDESFLLYSEETEYALRAADLGYRLWYEPAAVFEHLGGESNTDPALWALLTVNKVRLLRRRRGAPAGAVYRAGMLAGQLARAATGRPTARAAVAALLLPGRRMRVLPG
jgi:GT2 family glycosyltransferase